MGVTKQEILDKFNDIDFVYNNSSKHETLSRMIDELLKEQEAVEPTVGGITEHDGHGSWWYQCGKCKMPIDYGDKFCKRCGKAVKWDG